MSIRMQKLVSELCLMDDDFMSWAFDGNSEITEFFLSVVLPELHLKIEKVETQKKFKNLFGSDIQIDILAQDQKGKQYNIEIQRTGAIEDILRRARYYGGLLDSSENPEGKYRNLKDKYIIFYTEHDIMQMKKPIYFADRTVDGTDCDDGLHMVYLNMSYDGDDSYGRLNRDFKNPGYEDMNYPILKKTVKRMKTEENEAMCEKLEKFKAEIVAEVTAEAEAKAEDQKKENVIQFYRNGVSAEIIAKSWKITDEEVNSILKDAGLI